MDSQQVATRVAQLESRVAALEDEGKIVKGEVKQILTEIRSAILVRDNPFENENIVARSQPAPAPSPPAYEPAPQPAPQPEPAPQPQRTPEPPPAPEPAYAYEDEPVKEPIMLRPHTPPLPEPEPEAPQWSLLTVAGIAAWAEDAVRRVGPLRLEILLDLCEAAGHLTREARTALSRVTELELPEPEQPPSTNETVVILRQLDALVNDEEEDYGPRLQRRV